MNSLFSCEATRSQVWCCEYKYNLIVGISEVQKIVSLLDLRKLPYIIMVQQNVVLIFDCGTKRLVNSVTRTLFSNMINYPNTCATKIFL